MEVVTHQIEARTADIHDRRAQMRVLLGVLGEDAQVPGRWVMAQVPEHRYDRVSSEDGRRDHTGNEVRRAGSRTGWRVGASTPAPRTSGWLRAGRLEGGRLRAGRLEGARLWVGRLSLTGCWHAGQPGVPGLGWAVQRHCPPSCWVAKATPERVKAEHDRQYPAPGSVSPYPRGRTGVGASADDQASVSAPGPPGERRGAKTVPHGNRAASGKVELH